MGFQTQAGWPRLIRFGIYRGGFATGRGGPGIALDVWVAEQQEATRGCGESLPVGILRFERWGFRSSGWTDAMWPVRTSCSFVTQTLKAASGPPRHVLLDYDDHDVDSPADTGA